MDFRKYLNSQSYQRLIDEDFSDFITDGFIYGKPWRLTVKWLQN